MKMTRRQITGRYLTLLGAHLAQKPVAGRNSPSALGRNAVAANLATADLARIHQHALAGLALRHDLTRPRSRPFQRAQMFFSQVMAPVEEERRAMQRSNRDLARRVETLRLQAAAIARRHRQLEREVIRRKAGEARIVEVGERYRALFRASELMQGKLRKLTRQILAAQETERTNISRELHDEVVQTLVGINVELAALSQSASTSVLTLNEKIAQARRLVGRSVRAVHRFARELRPTVLDDIGLIPALHALSKTLADKSKLRIKMTASPGVEALGIAKRTVLYRVAQEALTNVARHAEATLVRLSITQQAGGIQLEIGDNGKSFPVAATLQARNNRRLGLIGMRERVEMVGGRFAIESVAAVGTTIRAVIPFQTIHPFPSSSTP